MKKTMEESQRFGAQGIKVMIAGRLNGAEIATNRMVAARPPAASYAESGYRLRICRSLTTFGIIGIKVWIYRGEILDPNASMARGTTSDPVR